MVVFEANNSDYSTISILGQCWSDIIAVHLAKHLPSGKMVVVKRFNMDKIKEDASLIQVNIICCPLIN